MKLIRICDHFDNNYDVDMETGCWNWRKGKCNGYGCLRIDGKQVNAHRHYYETFVGPIPENMVIHHTCNNPICVNPDHLEIRTYRENVLAGNGPTAKNARKTHCINGHEFNLENTYTRPDGERRCNKCISLNNRKYKERNKCQNP